MIVIAMRVAGDKGGNGNGSKSNGNRDKGGRQATRTATRRVMVMGTRVAGKQHQWQ